MPYYFLSDEAAQVLRNELAEQIKELEVASCALDNQIFLKKGIWNDLGSKVEQIAPKIEQISEKVEQKPGEPFALPEETVRTQLKQYRKLIQDNPDPFNSNLTKQKLIKSDLTIEKFLHDKTQEKSYKTLFYFEHPDGRVVLLYMANKLCTTKEKILALPYPIPKGYLKETGLTTNQITAIRFYRELLFTQNISENTRKNTANVYNCTAGAPGANPSVQEDPEDWKYRPILNTNTRPNRDEEKIEGALE